MGSNIYKSDEEVEDLLNHKNNGLVKIQIIGSGNHGNHDRSDKNNGNQHRDLETKEIVGTLGRLMGVTATSELTGVSKTQVSNYRNGKNSNGDVKAEIINAVNTKLSKISDKALEKVEKLVESFDDNRMGELKASEIAGAAEKLMNIVEKASPKSDNAQAQKPQIIIHAPKQLNVTQYLVKEV